MTTNRVLLAVDPGKMTGYALYDTNNDRFMSAELPHFEFLVEAERILLEESIYTVICERFVITKATLEKTRQPWSIEQIGCLRYRCQTMKIPFYLQTAAEGKAFSTDTKLKTIGFYTPNSKHANDAARHLLLWMASHGYIPISSLIEGD